MEYQYIVQAVGFSAVIFALAVYQSNKRHRMLGLATIAACLFASHFFLLGAMTGAAMNLIGAARSYVFMKVKPRKRNRWILFSFLVAAVLATAATWHGPISLLALLGTMCSAVSSWQRSPRLIRRFALATPFPWFAYAVLTGSMAGMVIETMSLTSNLIGRHRHDANRRFQLRLVRRVWRHA